MRSPWPFARSPLVAALALGVSVVAVVAAQQPGAPAQPPPPSVGTPQSQPQPPRPTFRTGVSLVRVDVTVTGRNDTPVSDLTAEDFEVREDGVVQPIQSVQFIRLTGTASDDTSLEIRSPEHAEAEAAREDVRVFAIFLDDYHITREPQITLPLRKVLAGFINRYLQPTDLVAIMDPVTPLSALEFTRDKAALLERVNKYEGRKGNFGFLPPRSAMEEAQMSSRDAPRLRAQVTLSALNALVTRLGALRERRSSVLFISEGPPLVFRDGTLNDEMEEVLRSANRGNVTINVLDPRGLGQWGTADSLWRLAGETGGRAILGTNGFDRGLTDIVQDASAYYLLAYEPTRAADDGKFHQIDVRVKRGGMKVTARKGYWAPGEKELSAAAAAAQAEVAPEVKQAMQVFAAPKGGTKAAVWIGLEPTGGAGARVRLTWQPTASAAAGEERPVSLTVKARDAQERTVAEVKAGRPEAGASAPAGEASFDAPPGPLKLTITLEDAASGVVDHWVQSVEVPDLSTSPGTLGTPSIWIARSPREFRDISNGDGGVVPSPQREFRRTDRVLVRVPSTPGAAAPAAVQVRLLDRSGKELAKLPSVALSAARAQFEVPISSLAIGEYLLELAPEGRTDEAARQLVAFRVVP